jgi:hypothetical protein
MTPEDEERTRPLRERRNAADKRMFDAIGQMQARGGPYYEQARQRSQVIAAAYRAAGRPRRVHRICGLEGFTHAFFVRRGGSLSVEPATEADANAWYAWWRERDRLRRELGSKRGQRKPVDLASDTETNR